MYKKALVLWGGWEGHKPFEMAKLISASLDENGWEVTLQEGASAFDDAESLKTYQLICPNITMGKLTEDQQRNLCNAVKEGSGLGGFHGGAGDAFRGSLEYEWMLGGHFVSHPHVGKYEVRKRAISSAITEPLPERFEYESEQYYMLCDPAIQVLAETRYRHESIDTTMPVVWIRTWGRGRVFYSALGHKPEEFEQWPFVWDMTVRGLLWAGKALD